MVTRIDSPAKIGPNALIQTVQATREIAGETHLLTALRLCGEEALLDDDPEAMVDERRFDALIRTLVEVTGAETTATILHRSGRLTAEYLLANRIPKPFQALLRLLPRRWALSALLLAIRQHAWTFTGSGQFDYHIGAPSTLTIACTIHDAASAFYGGTFTHLFQTLVAPHTTLEVTTTPRPPDVFCAYVVHF